MNRYFSRLGLTLLCTVCAVGARAQTPEVSVTDGLPLEPLIGENFCAQLGFRNSETATTGYGPYIVGVFAPGLGNASASFVDVPPEVEFIGQYDGVTPLTDPVTGQELVMDVDDVAYLARLPVGSLNYTDDPVIALELCAQVLPGAAIGQPLDIEFYGGFEFGDDPTGTGAPIGLEGPESSTITPQLARVEKINTAPENERPPGPSHPFSYVLTMDISDQVSIDNLLISDDLPDGIVWTGDPVSVVAPQGNGCSGTVTPAVPDPSNIVEVSCTSVTGTTAAVDLEVRVRVYIDDILDESVDNTSQLIPNTADFEYSYTDPDNVTTDISQSDDNNVLAIPAAIQKDVAGTAVPGGTLTYTTYFEVTDYGTLPGASDFLITDVLPDGSAYLDTLSLVVDGATVPITATVTGNFPNPGETTLEWDIGAAFGANIPAGANGTLVYEAEVLPNYNDGVPVVASDVLVNNIDLDFQMADGGTGNNTSSEPATVPPNEPSKILIDPADPMQELMPGQTVTFRLTVDIPAGQTDQVTLTDILPLPVFDVDDPGINLAVNIAPAPFYDFGLDPGDISTDPALNAVIIDVGDVITPVPVTIGVDITVTVSDEPFADNLYLTNLLVSSYEDSSGAVDQLVNAESIMVGAPELLVTKGVSSVDNPAAVLEPADLAAPAEPIDNNATGVDASDTVIYAITVENIGGQSAYSVRITDPAVAGMSCDPTPVSINNGNGSPLAAVGGTDLAVGLELTDPLAPNDGTPGAPFSDDTAIIEVSCQVDGAVNPGQEIINEASVVWKATASPASPDFAPVTDDAMLTMARPTVSKQLLSIAPGYTGSPFASIGEIVQYQVEILFPEGVTPNVQLVDLPNPGLAFLDPTSVTVVTASGVSFSGTGTASLSSSGSGATAADRQLTLDLGDVTNGNSGNSGSDTITVTYSARVLNAAVNTSEIRRRNTATLGWDEGGANTTTQAQADPVIIAEPALAISKTISPVIGDDTTTPTVTITVQHAGNSTAPAFDVVLEDILPFPAFLDVLPGSLTLGTCDVAPDSLNEDVGSEEGISANWARIAIGESCTLEFQFDVLDSVPAGAFANNCADTYWQSLATADQPLAVPPTNTLGVERTGDAADPGELNDYSNRDCATFQIFDVGIAKTVIDSTEPQTDNLPGTPAGAESLTIGEQVTFELIATIPEAPVWDLSISDLLPSTGIVLRVDSATAQALPATTDLTIDNATPTATLSDSDGDGIDDQAVLAFGNVDKIAFDGVTDDDRIRVRVEATVMDVAKNANNDLDDNAGLVSYRTALDPDSPVTTQSASYTIELVEPLLQVEKTADTSTGEAGDVVTYTVLVTHTAASRVDAENLALEDILPAELQLVDNSWAPGSCTTGPGSISGDVGSNTVQANWSSFPLGASCEITFQANIDVAAITGDTLTNTTSINWTSLTNATDPESRPYSASDSWDVVVSLPGLDKVIAATSSIDTPFTPGEPVTQLTIGETVSFLVDAAMPDGTTPDVTISDLLPTTGVELQITATELVSVGSDISYTEPVAAGDAATCPTTAECSWFLGEVTNLPDNRPDPDLQDQIVFLIEAVVLDSALNSGVPGADDDLPNTARFDSPVIELQDQAVFDIVEPLLQIDKFTQNGSKLEGVSAGGEIHRFTLRIAHTADSTATARNLLIEDTLDASMLWVDDTTVSSDCPGWVLAGAPTAGATGVVQLSIDSLPVTTASCEISFDVEMVDPLATSTLFPNQVTLDWESLPGATNSRPGFDDSSADLFFLADAFLDKRIVATSVDQTGSALHVAGNPDATIGEVIEYEVTAYFADGATVDNVSLLDTLDSGLALISAELVALGDNLSSTDNTVSEPGSGQIQVDYGTVTNSPADGVTDERDKAVYRVLARVEDVATNTSGSPLTNTVEMTYDVAATPNTVSASATVDVVQPGLAISKTFAGLAESVASISLEVTNTADAPGFDLNVIDDLDPATWEAGSMVPVTVPTGFVLSEGTAPSGDIRIELSVDNPGPAPTSAQVLAPGDAFTIEFTMTLANGGLLPGVTDVPNTALAYVSSLPDGASDPADAGIFVADTEQVVEDSSDDTLLFPQLDLRKSWNGPNNPALPGDTITYTLELENSGSGPATDVVITDTPDAIGTLIAGSVTTSVGTVIVGNASGDTRIEVNVPTVAALETVTVSYQVTLPYPYPDGMSAPERLVNQAAADSLETPALVSDDTATTAVDDDATIVPVLADPIMAVTKDDQLVQVPPGGTISYLIDYSNNGNQDATGVFLRETVPDNTSFNSGASSTGWVCAAPSAGSICTLDIGNLPGAGGNGTVVFAVDVDSQLPAGIIEVFNTVFISEDGVEHPDTPSPALPPSTDTDNELTLLDPFRARPDLQILKTDGAISVTPGQEYFYLLEYRNVGAQTATGVFIEETVPQYTVFDRSASSPGTWTCANGAAEGTVCRLFIGALATGQGGTARFGLRVADPVPSGVTQIDNTASIDDDGTNSVVDQYAESADVTPLIATPDIAVSKRTDVTVARKDEVIPYTIDYANLGNQDATGVVVRELVPPGTTYSEADSAPTTWSCPDESGPGTVCRYDVGLLAAGDSGTLTFAVKVVVDESKRDKVVNIVEANDDGSNGPDPTPSNNASSVVTPFLIRGIPIMGWPMLVLCALVLLSAGGRQLRRRQQRTFSAMD